MTKVISLIVVLCLISCDKSHLNSLNEIIYIRNKGADMPAYIHGNAQDNIFIVVLHGGGSFGLAYRNEAFVDEIEKKYAVVYWDQRAQSMSQGHNTTNGNNIETMVDDTKTLINVLKKKYGDDIKLFLMGHSWGGALGGTLLLEDNQQSNFRGWIEIDGAHDFRFAGTARRKLLLEIAEEQINDGRRLEEWQSFHSEVSELDSIPGEDYQKIFNKAQYAVNLLGKDNIIYSSNSKFKLYRAIVENNPINWQVMNYFHKPFIEARDMDYSISNELYKLKLPTLLLWGKFDISVPPILGYDAFNKIGSANKKLIIFEHSVHHPHDTEGSKFSKEVIEFIEAFK